MNNIIFFIVATGLIIFGFLFSRWKKEQKQKKRELEEARLRLYNFYKSKLSEVTAAIREFRLLLTYETGYFTNFQWTSWYKKYSPLFNEIEDKPFENVKLKTQDVSTIKSFLDFCKNGKTLRNDFNKSFVNQELKDYSSLFDNIEGRKLDKQQRTAIVTDEDNNIIIAGAGSGKTTTIVGKVNYVIDRYKTNPKEVLLISFTKKSAAELGKRIDIEGVEAKTFHKFGKDVIAEVEGKQPSIFDEDQFERLLRKIFNELIKNEDYLQKVTEYFTDFMKPVKSQFEFENQGDCIQYLKEQNIRTYRLIEVITQDRRTLRREVVKSIEECKIANFLLFNGINYEYEDPYEHETANRSYRQYKPDFRIKQNGRTVYIEHFAVDKNGNVPRFFAREKETYKEARQRYLEKIEWARDIHRNYGTTLIETFSYEMFEGTLYENLSQKLIEAGIKLYPKSTAEIWEIIYNAAKDEVENFITLFQTFLTLMKSNNYSISDVNKKNSSIQDDSQRKRNALFSEIFKPIYERYERHLAERKEIDFCDMINKASNYISIGTYNRKFGYVIIDEFQDISIGRYQLVKAIKTRNPACKLFCVGDDWQSIYRFTGSDIALFKDFEKYFGYTAKSKIETTYRFHNPLIKLSSDFILKNPNQAKKELKSNSLSKSTDYKIVYSDTNNQDDTLALKQSLDELIETDSDIAKKELFLLGRYNSDIDRIKNEQHIFSIERTNNIISFKHRNTEGGHKTVKLRFLTIHKAKGLEADIVIVINCNSGKHGLPSQISDDPVLDLLLSEADQFENGEERRVFYVGMTRAREKVFFIADSSYKSKFITELEVESGNTSVKKCPRCITADLVYRTGTSKNGRKWAFWGCSNYLYGCDYKEWVDAEEEKRQFGV